MAQPHVHDGVTLVDAAWEAMPAWTGGTARDMRYVDIASAIDRAPFVYEPGADAGAAIGDTARARSLLDRARQAGLSDAELSGLETRLRSGKFDTADALLMGRLLDSPNAARALRTFLGLASLRDQYPQRVTHSVVETLARGVAHPRTGATEGGEGLLSPAQAHDAAMALARMSTRDFETIQFALFFASPIFQTNPRADAQVQAALALKAVAARRGEFSVGEAPLGLKLNLPPSVAAQDIARFIAQTKDVDADVLIARASGIDVDGGGAGLAAE